MPDATSAVAAMEGTLFVKHQRETVDGNLSACGLQFAVVAPDRSTGRGATVKLSGRYDLRRWPQGGPGYSLKLAIYDGTGWLDPVAPNYAFVRAPHGSPPRKALRLDAQTPGHALFFDSLDGSFDQIFASIVEDRLFVLGFNRAAGQQDVDASVDLRVSGTRIEDGKVVRDMTPAIVDDFVTCTHELFR